MKFIVTILLAFNFTLNAQLNFDTQDYLEALRIKTIILDSDDDLQTLVDRSENSKLVLLGESTHGTSEYYLMRGLISKRLIEQKNFSFIAVEGDWATCYKVNQYIKGLPGSGNSAREVLKQFNRWPTWLWANEETIDLVEWLKRFNDKLPQEKKIGFYGIDLYSLMDSIEEVIKFFKTNYPEGSLIAESVYNCFANYDGSPQLYAQALRSGNDPCVNPITDLIQLMRNKIDELTSENPKEYFNAKLNSLAIKSGEKHYRAMLKDGPDSWNYRVDYMLEVIKRLLEFHGDESKGIIWAHNTHIGDARATSMSNSGMKNIGQLTRELYGRENIFSVGFSTYRGTVIAGSRWGSPLEIMYLPPAHPNSLEEILSRLNVPTSLLFFNSTDRKSILSNMVGHRAVGVTYNPSIEHLSNYVGTILPERYDALIFIEDTKALTPIE